MSDVAVLVPWRDGDRHRERIWATIRPWWPWPVVEGSCEGPEWSKGAAVADARARVDAEVLVVADADVWADDITVAVGNAIAGSPWVVPHSRVHRLSATATATELGWGSAPPPPRRYDQPPYQGVVGGGIVVLRADVWDACPIDPRFIGWGQEDESWGLALTSLFGKPMRLGGNLTHYWHPPQPRQNRRVGSPANWELHRRYARAARDPEAMRALIAEFH